MSRSELDCKRDNIPRSAPRVLISLCCSPFSVTPAVGTLGIGDAVQVTVGFQPLKSGDYSASLVVRYDTGERWALHRALPASLKGEPFLSRKTDVAMGLKRETMIVFMVFAL